MSDVPALVSIWAILVSYGMPLSPIVVAWEIVSNSAYYMIHADFITPMKLLGYLLLAFFVLVTLGTVVGALLTALREREE